jgi:predicted RNA-binding Zn-ribbon protein involved in translation (DUF1610 family)
MSRRAFLDASGKVAFGMAASRLCAGAEEATKRQPRYDSYCGLYCGACPNLVQSEAAASPDKVKCLGCKSGTAAGWCAKCNIKQCAAAKGFESCSQCQECPCEQLKAFHNVGRDYRLLAAKNLNDIRGKGQQTWLKEQKARWTCPGCGTRFSWKDEACPKCGKQVYTCKKEAQSLRKD